MTAIEMRLRLPTDPAVMQRVAAIVTETLSAGGEVIRIQNAATRQQVQIGDITGETQQVQVPEVVAAGNSGKRSRGQ